MADTVEVTFRINRFWFGTAFLYCVFAAVSGGSNLATQSIVLWALPDLTPSKIIIALVAGTAVGLLIKFALDRTFIFADAKKSIVATGSQFVLYSAFSVLTTAIFWGIELLFHFAFGTHQMALIGGAIGLAIGYFVKFQIDRRVTFHHALPDLTWIYSSTVIGAALAGYATYLTMFSPLRMCGTGGDCYKYLAMARMFQEHAFAAVDYPFNVRIAAPWLASLFSDPTFGFSVVNIGSWFVFGFFSATCLFLLKAPLWLRALPAIYMAIHPLGAALYIATPASTDPMMYAVFAACCALFVARWMIPFYAIALAGVFVKESFLLLAAAGTVASVASLILDQESRSKAKIEVLAGLLSIVAASALAAFLKTSPFPQAQAWAITTIGTVTYWLTRALEDPARFVVWVASVFAAFGLFLSLMPSMTLAFQRPRDVVFFGLLAAAHVSFSLVAGADMSRIAMNGILSVIVLAIISSGRDQTVLIAAICGSILTAVTYPRLFGRHVEYFYYGGGKVSDMHGFIAVMTVASIALAFAHVRRRSGRGGHHVTDSHKAVVGIGGISHCPPSNISMRATASLSAQTSSGTNRE